MPVRPPRADAIAVASWICALAALAAVLFLHLVPALFAGLLVYELVHQMTPHLARMLPSERARLAAVIVLSTTIVGVLTFGIFGAVAFFRSDAGSLTALLQRMADIIDGARNSLPAWLLPYLPTDAEELRETLSRWLREHASDIRLWGTTAGRISFDIVIGMIIGAMVSMREVVPAQDHGPLAQALAERARRIADSFRRVVFAQVRISLINTAFTAIYLAIVLPAFGVHLPFKATLIGITFVSGLLPVAGNVISNTIIVVVSLSHSLGIALLSLAFLIVIHKLEYFLNARIVGTQIRARPWELLMAMLVMEAAFGVAGVAAAPIYYAYVKQELVDQGLI